MSEVNFDEEYEAERRANILANAQLLESLGLRSTSTAALNALTKPVKAGQGALKKIINKPPAQPRQQLQPRDKVPKRQTALAGERAWRASMLETRERKPKADGKVAKGSKSKRNTLGDFIEDDGTDREDEADWSAIEDEEFASSSTGSKSEAQRRRSARTQQKRKRYEESSDEEATLSQRQRNAQRMGERIHDPKTFGDIPGISVGKWWASRVDCSTDAVHAPTVAGISGNSDEGCWSIALSGGYEDDVDEGERFTFTGSGGRLLKGFVGGKRLNLRTAPQSSDQTFTDARNAAIVKSCETQRPIRVIRGFKGTSVWNPPEGYVYCGLYLCTRFWLETGQSGFKVCKFEFERMPDQQPLKRFDSQSPGPCASPERFERLHARDRSSSHSSSSFQSVATAREEAIKSFSRSASVATTQSSRTSQRYSTSASKQKYIVEVVI